MHLLLTRDRFRTQVFARDHGKCVVCGDDAVDAHHILERRLWPDGGYYVENGVSLCSTHHVDAESTLISCEQLRDLAKIKEHPLPPQLTAGTYDKWGNPVLPNGMRLRGELFWEPSVQKIIEPTLHLFTDRVKYPRTYHLPWSPGKTSDDRTLTSLDSFVGNDVVVTVKMDGENTTMYRDYLHARSLEYEHHPSRTWVKAMHASIANDIPVGWRLCGENCYAQHSIRYRNLPSYFMLFSVWNEKNVCLDWDQTVEWASLLGLSTVPVIYEGQWDERRIKNLTSDVVQSGQFGDQVEGYVVRLRDQIAYKDFRSKVGKYVRTNHVQTDAHWMNKPTVANDVRKSTMT